MFYSSRLSDETSDKTTAVIPDHPIYLGDPIGYIRIHKRYNPSYDGKDKVTTIPQRQSESEVATFVVCFTYGQDKDPENVFSRPGREMGDRSVSLKL